MQALQGVVSLELSWGPQVWVGWVPGSWELGFRTGEGSCALLWGRWLWHARYINFLKVLCHTE